VKDNPNMSDRAIGDKVGLDHKTIVASDHQKGIPVPQKYGTAMQAQAHQPTQEGRSPAHATDRSRLCRDHEGAIGRAWRKSAENWSRERAARLALALSGRGACYPLLVLSSICAMVSST
jgi:hypothetical protein